MSGGRTKPRGSGDRKGSQLTSQMTRATKELIKHWGQPSKAIVDGVHVWTWTVDPRGKGVVLGRLSSDDLKGNETAMGQIQEIVDLAKDHRLKPRLIILTLKNSGLRPYWNRPDLQLIEEGIYRGWLRWVAVRDLDRVGRSYLTCFLFFDLLIRFNIGLYVGEFGRRLDWEHDDVVVAIKMIVASEETKLLRRRTQAALQRQYVDDGSPWPSVKPFGFRRDGRKLVPDTEGWRVVREVFRLAAKGLTKREIASRCPVSQTAVLRIVNDEIYVTGEYSFDRTQKDGTTKKITGHVDRLPKPISRELAQRAREQLALRRGPARKSTPTGFFGLNGILGHSCGERLTGATGGRKQFDYRHRSPLPDCCGTFIVDQSLVEGTVARVLRKLVNDPVAQEQALLAAGHALLDRPEVRRLRERLALLKEEEATLRSKWTEELLMGDRSMETAERLLGRITDEVDDLRRRIELADALGKGPRPTFAGGRKVWAKVFKDLLTEDVPASEGAIQRRAWIIRSCSPTF